MRSYTLAASLVASLLSSCTFGSDRDYQVVVSWLLNGFAPDRALCDELGIAKARLEVSSGAGTRVKVLEANCEGNIENSEGHLFGGFITTRAFAWDVDYTYTLSLLDSAGNVRSEPPATGAFVAGPGTDYYELGYLDYLAPKGNVAALHAEWSVRSGDVAAACAAERIATVRITAVSALNEKFEAPVLVAEAPCAAERISSNGAKILATGDYLFRYEAFSEAGSLVEAGAPIPVEVNPTTGADIVLPRELFLN